MHLALIWLLVATVVLALGAVFGVFGGSNPARSAARRLQSVRLRHSDKATDKVEAQYRKTVAARRPGQVTADGAFASIIASLNQRLQRTGRNWTVQRYLQVSAGIAVGLTLIVGVRTGSMALGLVVGAIVGLAGPNFWVSRTISKRINRFVATFPDALELLVRALRTGLPISETMGVVATEMKGPVAEEFKRVNDRIRVGRSTEEALNETADRLELPEFSFFCVALAIQRETGGNLAETLANLADVLRKRAQMKLKIRAMSSEAKASAWIIGVLPFIVFALMTMINPGYTKRFFIDQRLMLTGLGGLSWLSLGAFIMSRMVNFEI